MQRGREWLECAHCRARSRSAELGECLWHPSNRAAAARRAVAEAARLAELTAAREEAERLVPEILAADPDSLIGARDVVPGNLLLMASVWDQCSADAACAAFASLPAGVRWGLHCEPLLGPIDIVRACIDATPANHRRDLWPSWVVCENGPGARPMDPQWALDLREQCRAAGVPFHLDHLRKESRLACPCRRLPKNASPQRETH